MVDETKEQLSVADVTRREVALYAGNTHGAKQYALLDDQHQIYAVVTVPANPQEQPAWVGVMTRVIGDLIVIDEDTSLDKPLVEALVVNGGVPREKNRPGLQR
jgi:hypothetical protein